MIYRIFWNCLLVFLPSLVVAQSQFTQPNGSLRDFSQTFVVGSSVQLAWKAGWDGYGQDPGYADLFVVSFESDAYSAIVFANKSTAEGGAFAWRVNIPEDSVRSENGKFVFKFVKALNPPNYAGANPAATLSPSRGFNVRLAASSSSTTLSTTSSASLSASAASSTPLASTSSHSPDPSSVSTRAPESKTSTPIGAIVGGVVGGLIALGAILYLLFRLRQMKKAQAASQTAGSVSQLNYHAPGFAQGSYQFKAVANMPHELPATQAPVEADIHHSAVYEK